MTIIIIICNQALKSTTNPMPTYKPKTSICPNVPNVPCCRFLQYPPNMPDTGARHTPLHSSSLDPKYQTHVHKRPWTPVPYGPVPNSNINWSEGGLKPSALATLILSLPPSREAAPSPAAGSLPPPPASGGPWPREGLGVRPTRTLRVARPGGGAHRPDVGQ